MSFLRSLFLGFLGFVLLVFALANLQPVSVAFLPGVLADAASYVFEGADAAPRAPGDQPFSIDGIPLFVVILASAAMGLAIGFTWEWLREHKHRSEAARQRAEKERLERQLAKERGPTEQDDVLALVERNT
ncbi:LapA family protein [Jannaschia aquimarina]|uniref:Lipopolysaccharide assembly protein A domain-containing protein n=1 Tax=Jannaschia aquimarina TaxID=935700 RepID=A0A0D1E9V0_9RHOB|nr:LapA family protein [Jannaschia aquimarina]KIT14469.1 hypothetical protein jaqu_37590 [Jannaschia aquimarina]SNT28945.1 Uncharacterized integral membrane protein [Jannaschia aquimarina]